MPVKMKSGKSYLTVVERMNMLLKELSKQDYSIQTEVTYESGVVIVKATLILYTIFPKRVDEDGTTVRIEERKYTGHALGELGKAKTLEATETHAIGRALSSAGWFGDEFASANEMEAYEKGKKEKPKAIPEDVNPLEDEKHPLEDDVRETMGGVSVEDNGEEITFGKHKGKLWSELDEGYVDWVANKSNVDWQRDQGKAELKRRSDSAAKKADEKVPF